MKDKFECCTKEIRLSASEKAKWIKNGWLGQDGICDFPEEVQATMMDVRLRGLPKTFWATATDKKITEAIGKGWIVFVDGNGHELTAAQWSKRYPEFPDPVYLAQLLKKLPPPSTKNFIQIGRSR